MSKVYVVRYADWEDSTGEYYADRGVVCVADNLLSAIDHVKSMYSAPYVVAWNLRHEGNKAILSGTFEEVNPYWPDHVKEFEMELWDLLDAAAISRKYGDGYAVGDLAL